MEKLYTYIIFIINNIMCYVIYTTITIIFQINITDFYNFFIFLKILNIKIFY